MVTNGQLVVGGEVMNDDDFDGFDYIADIKIEKIQNGNTVYAVSIRRMRCVDEEIVKESQISQNAVVFNLDDDSQSIVERQLQVRKPLPKTQQISGTIYAASQPQDSLRKQNPYAIGLVRLCVNSNLHSSPRFT
ncbi:hypothetical protein KIN20_019123 [Parelaphostrongylus tenuis]|uniref:Uncharacterized protein n=1 Tax=Parelaphostrongylus tenuis TaxID=148309 RepID=A0AAD5N2S3_PARTN|nr:hypothetical protein KIN20_019123 [Parelaphostrongylus tenuis]